MVISIGRRQFISALGGAALAHPLAARAQQPDRMRLIGVLMGFAESDRASQSLVTEFRAALMNLGWKEGSNLRIELRWGAGDVDRIGALAKELIDLRPDTILAQTTPVAVALARATKTIPIVFVTVSRWGQCHVQTARTWSKNADTLISKSVIAPSTHPISLVNKASRRCLRLRANRLRNLESRPATVPSYVGGARPDRHLKHWRAKNYADDRNITAGY
jgi:hypothetical protein